MKCAISVNINKGTALNEVKMYGAKSVLDLSEVKVDKNTLNSKMSFPRNTKLAKNPDLFNKGASYIFSNSGKFIADDFKALNVLKDPKILSELVSSGSNLYKGIAEEFFKRKKDSLISNTPNNTSNYVINNLQGKPVPSSNSRTYLTITREDLAKARKIVNKEFNKVDDPYLLEATRIFNEGLEFLIISSLYRGFDVVIEGPIESTIVDKAINKYNVKLGSKKDVTKLTTDNIFSGGAKVLNPVAHIAIEEAYKKNKFKGSIINTSNLVLNMFTTKNERKTLEKHKKASTNSRILVANRIIKVFKNIIPNLESEILSTYEIAMIYGDTFANKKGFIIGNKIILNADTFSMDTVFHEFSHYYSAWLKEDNPEMFSKLMEVTEEKHADLISGYTTMYENTGLKFSKNDIIEEIFADQIGMKAAKELDQAMDEYVDDSFEETIDKFSQAFLIKLTGNSKALLNKSGLTLDSTIADVFNIGILYAGENTSELLERISSDEINRFKDFFIDKYSVREVYNGLVNRGLITFAGNNKIVLRDINGNRYDENGVLSKNSNKTVTFKPWDTYDNIKYNNKKLDEITGYLNRFKNYASVMFSIKNTAHEVQDIIQNHSNNITLDIILNKYKDTNNNIFNRTTEYITDEFTDGKATEDYIVLKVYNERITAYIEKELAKEGVEDTVELREAAKEYALEYITSPTFANSFKKSYNKVGELFKFKTEEGTYLHTLAELYFRTLNFSNKIQYNTKREGGFMHFAKGISEAIGSTDVAEFEKYFETNFFNELQGQEGSPEYKSFLDAYNFIKETKIKRDVKSIAASAKFIALLEKEVIPHILDLPGPIVLMPEVKLSSKSFGVAGTIDLIVIDGTGKARIFDFKTKEENKRPFWNYSRHLRRLKGVMSGYSDNAMIKASIQTSMYKVMLKEMGIEVVGSKIFYVESSLQSSVHTDDQFAKAEQMHYNPKNIFIEGVQDVSAELLDHFKKEGKESELFTEVNLQTAVSNAIITASGGINIDVDDNLEAKAKGIYERALRDLSKIKNGSVASKAEIDILSQFNLSRGSKVSDKNTGLKVFLGGRLTETLEAGVMGDDAIQAIVDLLKNRKAVRNMASSLETVFNSMDRSSNESEDSGLSRDLDSAFRGVLADTDSTTHELTRLASNINYGLDFSDVLFVKNKITHENRVVILNHDRSKLLPFGPGHNNIFGKYLSNNGARIALPTINWKGTNHNMRLVKAGIMMALQKSIDPSFNVNLIVSNKAEGQENTNMSVPNLYDMSTLLLVTKTLLINMKAAGEVLPPEIEALLDTPSLFDSKNYMANPITALSEFLSMATGDLVKSKDVYFGTGLKRKNELIKVLDNYRGRQDTQGLIDSLLNFQKSVEYKLKTDDDKLRSDLWTLLDHVIMDLMGLNYAMSPKNTTFSNNFLGTTSKMSNHLGSFFNRKIAASQTAEKEAFIEYRNEHAVWLNKLAEEKGISLTGGRSLYMDSMKSIFKNLWSTDNKDRETAFVLKNYKTGANLSSLERKYLKYLEEVFTKFGNQSSFSKIEIPAGWSPLVKKSKLSYRNDTSAFERARKTVKDLNFNRAMKDEDNISPIESEFAVESKFKGQLPNSKSHKEEQFSDSRRSLLGLDSNMIPFNNVEDNHPLDMLEDNVENIVDAFVSASLDAYHYREISAFGRSLYYNIKRYERVSKLPYHKIIETISLIQKRVINHEESDANNKVMNVVDGFATNAAIAGTVGQALLETFTNPLVTTAHYVSDKLYGTLFKGTREFSLKSYTTAVGMVTGGNTETKSLIRAIDSLYGISNSDTRALKQMLKMIEGRSLFQSSKLMFINKIMMQTWQKVTLVAYMLEQGTFFAHSLDSVGNLVYDESKDKRFKTKEGKKLYSAVKLELSKQKNGLTGNSTDEYEDRKLNKAWTVFDSNHVKELIVELYSSLDDTSKSLSMYYTWMQFMIKFRSWIFSKVPRYFQKPLTAEENESAGRPTKVLDPNEEDGYRIEFKGEATEGILYTLVSISKQLAEYKLQVFKKGSLTPKQKKNMSLLMGDVIVSTTMAAAASGIFALAFDDDDKIPKVVLIAKDRWDMASSDVVFIKSLADITTGNSSMFIGVSIAARAVKAAFDAAVIFPVALTNPEVGVSDVLSAQNKLMGSLAGWYKSVELVYDTIESE
jgi:hypothetical protein